MKNTESLINELAIEQESIDDKYKKLSEFIDHHGSEIKINQLKAMETQRSAMFVYAYALGVRIDLLQKEI